MQLAINSSKGNLFAQGSSLVYQYLLASLIYNRFADASGNDKYDSIPDYH